MSAAVPERDDEYCYNCAHFGNRVTPAGLSCHRLPPVVMYDPASGATIAQFPETSELKWCSYFKRVAPQYELPQP
jgi:hypothetical protein